MGRRVIADFLFNVLSLFSRTEQPSQAELIAYGKELERRHVDVWADPVRPLITEPITEPISNPHGAYFLQERKRYMQHIADRDTQELQIVFWEERGN